MSQTPTTLEYRVTLPQRAPRPYQTLAGLLGYPSLTFDAFHDLGVPRTTRKRTLPRATADRLAKLGGRPFVVYLRQALRRDGVDLEEGQELLDHIPGKLLPELRAQVERLGPAASKTLHLAAREVRDLVALGFTVESLDAPVAEPETEESEAA